MVRRLESITPPFGARAEADGQPARDTVEIGELVQLGDARRLDRLRDERADAAEVDAFDEDLRAREADADRRSTSPHLEADADVLGNGVADDHQIAAGVEPGSPTSVEPAGIAGRDEREVHGTTRGGPIVPRSSAAELELLGGDTRWYECDAGIAVASASRPS